MLLNGDPAHPGSRPSDGPCVLLVKAYTLPFTGTQQQLAATVGQACLQQHIPFPYGNGIDAFGTRIGIRFQGRFLHRSPLGTQHYVIVVDVLLVGQVLHIYICANAVPGLNVDHILNGPALGRFISLGYFVYLQPEALPVACKEQHGTVHVGRINMFYEIFLARVAPPGTHPAPALQPVFVQVGPFDVTQVRDGDHHVFIGIKVFRVEITGGILDDRPAGIVETRLDIQHLLLDQLHLQHLAAQQFIQVPDQFHQLVILGLQTRTFQPCKLTQTHFHDCRGLFFAKAELFLQALAGFVNGLRCADQGDYLVQDVQRLEQPFQDMRTFGGLVAFKMGTSYHHLMAVPYKIFDQLLQVQQARTSVHQGNVVDRKAALHGRVLEQAVQHHVGHGTDLQFDDNAHAVPVTLVVHKRDALHAFAFHQLGNLFNKLPFVDHVGNLGHHYGFAAARSHFYIGFGTDHNASASGFVSIADARSTVDNASGREIRAFHVLQQLVNGYVIGIYVSANGVHNFTQVVGRHIGGHSHGNPAGSVEKQQGNLGR